MRAARLFKLNNKNFNFKISEYSNDIIMLMIYISSFYVFSPCWVPIIGVLSRADKI